VADFNGEGWLVLAIAAGGAALAATNNALGALGHMFGFNRRSEERRRAEYDERALKIMASQIAALRHELEVHAEQGLSDVRQHVSAIQRGLDGKQLVMEQRIADLYKEMRDRDEQLANTLHTRIGADIREAEARLLRQLEAFGKHFSEIISTAISNRPPRR
jgi:hypothetical protein